jgi:hypothetical protein
MLGVGNTVNETPLLATPLTFTCTFPVVAPAGTGAVIVVAVHVFGVVAVPLNVTVLVPWTVPKAVPLMVTTLPTPPEVGERVVITGGGVTVNVCVLLPVPPIVTSTGPVVAPVGTGTTMVVPFQLVGVAAVPLKVTVLLPWVKLKFVPVIVTGAVTAPEVGERLVMVGAATNQLPLLDIPFTVTTTAPVVTLVGAATTIWPAAQLVGVAASP